MFLAELTPAHDTTPTIPCHSARRQGHTKHEVAVGFIKHEGRRRRWVVGAAGSRRP